MTEERHARVPRVGSEGAVDTSPETESWLAEQARLLVLEEGLAWS